MDRKGQAALVLIILIPVFMVLAAIIIDTGINMYYDKKLKNVTEDVVTNLLENENIKEIDSENEEQIEEIIKKAKKIYEDNKINTESLYIEFAYGERIILSNTHIYYSFMNSLFNKGNGNRQIFIEVEAYKDSKGEIVIEYKGWYNES